MGIKVILLCAGYGTRLERDIINSEGHKDLLGIAKAMLPIGGRPLITHWIDSLSKSSEFDHFYLTTNARFNSQFQELMKKYDSQLMVVNDGTTCNEDRFGAVASIKFAIDEFKLENDDVLVIGGDTLFYEDFSISDVVAKFKDLKSETQKCGLVMSYTCKDNETTKYGILEVDEKSGKVQSLIEKPQAHETKSRLACPCFYLLSSGCSSTIKQFLDEKHNAPLKEKDATGHLIKYLISNCDIYRHQISGRFDVGGLQSYEECNNYFNK